ncbi:MAG: hypothetical protein ACKVOU_11990 [Cytophagales bacterium]
MKTLSIIFSTIIAANVAFAQPKYNSMYSTHNYKMPNHAKVAKENNLDKTQSFNHNDEVIVGENAANYKNSFAKVSNNGGSLPILPVEIVVHPMQASANYKSNFKSVRKVAKQEAAPIKEEIAKTVAVSVDTKQ